MRCYPELSLHSEPQPRSRTRGQHRKSKMGACVSSALLDEDVYLQEAPGPLFFNPYVKGNRIDLDESLCCAQRSATFHDGLVFTNRPLRVHEVLSLRITQVEERWKGPLRVGLTCVDPSIMDPQQLPRFLCPDLSSRPGFWAAVLPDSCRVEGTLVQLWLDRRGAFWCKINQEQPPQMVASGLPGCCPMWGVVDVYGTTKAVQLLDPSQPSQISEKAPFISRSTASAPSPTKTVPAIPQLYPEGQLESCVVCFSSKVNVVILPCGHACLCYSCAQKVFKAFAKCPMCRGSMHQILRISPDQDLTEESQDPS
ncbi:E3 ubiquitin-protein ligase NEURL3 [Lissotriton helveticus]